MLELVARVVALAGPHARFGAGITESAHFVARDHAVAIAVDLIEALAEAWETLLRFVPIQGLALVRAIIALALQAAHLLTTFAKLLLTLLAALFAQLLALLAQVLIAAPKRAFALLGQSRLSQSAQQDKRERSPRAPAACRSCSRYPVLHVLKLPFSSYRRATRRGSYPRRVRILLDSHSGYLRVSASCFCSCMFALAAFKS